MWGTFEDFETFTEDRVKGDFRELGEIELVNFLREKCVFVFCFMFRGLIVIRNCAFVNFTNISNAIKAMDGIKLIFPLARLWARALYSSTHTRHPHLHPR